MYVCDESPMSKKTLSVIVKPKFGMFNIHVCTHQVFFLHRAGGGGVGIAPPPPPFKLWILHVHLHNLAGHIHVTVSVSILLTFFPHAEEYAHGLVR